MAEESATSVGVLAQLGPDARSARNVLVPTLQCGVLTGRRKTHGFGFTIFWGVFPSAISRCSWRLAFRSSPDRNSLCSIREVNHHHTRDSIVCVRTIEKLLGKEAKDRQGKRTDIFTQPRVDNIVADLRLLKPSEHAESKNIRIKKHESAHDLS
jgi:hypothetical protein